MKVRFLSMALEEMAEAAQYYEGQSKGLGEEFLQEVENGLGRITSFPFAWSKISEDLRHCNLRRFPFTLIYRVAGEETTIVSVFHQSRKPRSWKNRR